MGELESTERVGEERTVPTTWEEKVELCEKWKSSDLSKVQFCKRYNLVFTTFCGWCDRLWPKKRMPHFCEVSAVDKKKPKQSYLPIKVEINLSNQAFIRLELQVEQTMDLLRELLHATTAAR